MTVPGGGWRLHLKVHEREAADKVQVAVLKGLPSSDDTAAQSCQAVHRKCPQESQGDIVKEPR